MNIFRNLFRTKVDNSGLVKVFDEFIEQIYWGEDLSVTQADENLNYGLVELVYPDLSHRGNGLLVS
ncbi:hypothetical protein COU57_06770 [Candidatus Pacearchaeota archaeon CG10_big_fil_rev_8_21_14_0_10_32_14]|nr:MAG: hypothetical protein COU57_06770 [Candidatus Pacearchaeota archaeon CG10_big_fil_rev_8_21_14_0_10_32_14]